MGAEDEEIIHIDEDDATAMGVVADVDAGVTHDIFEAIFLKMRIDGDVPDTGSLFQSIQTLFELTNVVRMISIDEALGLSNVDVLSDDPVEKSGVHIHHVDFKVFLAGNGKKNAKTSKAAYWSEGLIVVDAFDLRVATDNETGLEAIDGAVSMLLDFEDPSSTDGFSIRRKRDEFPSVVLDEGIVFLLHCIGPSIRIT